MKKALVALIALVLLACGGFAYLLLAFPKVPPASGLHVEATAARLARGKYVANSVSSCIDCHSTRDWSRFSGPIVPGTEGKGGEKFDESMGLPGTLYARNLTPAHLGSWTDGEILRAFTEGVSRDGEALFPLMPYNSFRSMSREDAISVIAYLRTLKPVASEIPPRHLKFPMNVIVRTIPHPAALLERTPDPADHVAYGRYLTTVAACADCHTPAHHGKPLPGMDFAGGFEFRFPDGSVARSANITPDLDTGIGHWDKATFIRRFRTVQPVPVKPGEANTVMPWTRYQGMTDEDLGAIYEYLRTLKPVKHVVLTFSVR